MFFLTDGGTLQCFEGYSVWRHSSEDFRNLKGEIGIQVFTRVIPGRLFLGCVWHQLIQKDSAGRR